QTCALPVLFRSLSEPSTALGPHVQGVHHAAPKPAVHVIRSLGSLPHCHKRVRLVLRHVVPHRHRQILVAPLHHGFLHSSERRGRGRGNPGHRHHLRRFFCCSARFTCSATRSGQIRRIASTVGRTYGCAAIFDVPNSTKAAQSTSSPGPNRTVGPCTSCRMLSRSRPVSTGARLFIVASPIRPASRAAASVPARTCERIIRNRSRW